MTVSRRAVVTGVGAISAAGEDPAALAAALARGAALAAEITAFETAGPEPTRAAEIAGFDLARHVPSIRSYIDRTSALALAAAKLALEDASLFDKDARPGEIGLAFGTQWGCLDSMELFYAKLAGGNPRFAPPLPFSHSYANSPASVLAIELKLRGHHVVYSTGRTSGAWTLAGGEDAVELREADAIVCVAADSLSRAAFRHYCARGALLPDHVESPDEDAPGRFLLGEGAGAIVLEEASAAAARGAEVRARVLASGVAACADARSATEDAVRAALLRAGLLPGDVAAAFGTAAGRAAVEAELAAVASSLEIPLEKAREITVPAGAVLGETMGAGGALAAAAACAGTLAGPTLVLSVDAAEGGPSAVAVLLGPA